MTACSLSALALKSFISHEPKAMKREPGLALRIDGLGLMNLHGLSVLEMEVPVSIFSSLHPAGHFDELVGTRSHF
jgi:hypothetical protein